MSSSGAPIDGATIDTMVLDEQQPLGSTNSSGACVVELDPDADSEIVVSHPAHETVSAELSRPFPAEIELVMVPRGCIHGRVGSPSTVPVPEGFVVLAWPAGRLPDAGDVSIALSGSSDGPPKELHLARTGRGGEFLLVGLSDHEPYTISGFSRSMVCLERKTEVRTGERVDLVAHSLYGVHVSVVDELGNPVKTSPELFGRGHLWSCDPTTASPVLEARLEIESALELAGTPMPPLTSDSISLLFTAKEQVDFVGPIDYRVEIPGYRPVHEQLIALGSDSGLNAYTFTVAEAADGWGALEILCEGGEELRPETFGTLQLMTTDHDQTYTAKLAGACLDRCRLEGIPWGRYHAWFEAENSYFRYPAWDEPPILVEIGTSPGQARLSMANTGSACLRIEREGRPYEGPALLKVSDHTAGDPRAFFAGFDRAPYCLDLLPPGPYQISLDRLPGFGPPDAPDVFLAVSGAGPAEGTFVVR